MSSPARQDLTNVVAGDDYSLEIVILDDAGQPVNITGRNYIAQVRADPASTASPDASFTCTTPTPANGTVVCLLPDTESDNLSPDAVYWWSLLELAGSTKTTIVYGRLTVLWQIAKD